MSRADNAKRNIVWGMLQKFVSIFMPFLTRTVMIYILGMEYVGLNSLFTSILSMLSFAELGIGSALVFSMYQPIAENDEDKVCALLSFYRKCYFVIGCIIVSCGLVLMPFLDKLIDGSVPTDTNLYILFSIYLLNNALGYFLFAYKQSILMASQRVDVVSKVNLVINFISNVIQILLLIKFRNYYVYVVVLPVFTCINNVIVAVLTKKYYPQYVCRGKITKEEFKLIQKKVGGLLFQRIGNIVLCNVDTLVISGFLGLRLLGIYNGYYYVISALMGFLSVIQQALIPSVGNSIVKEDKIKNYKDFCKFHFMYLWIVSWCTTCILVLYQPFIKAWQGESNMLGMDMVILMSIYFFVYKMGDMSYIYKEAIGLWWEGKYVPLVSSIVNLVLNIMLVKIIGLPGIVISTIFSASLVNTPFGSRVLFKHYFESKMNWIKFLFATVLWFVKCTIACTVTYLITNELPQNILGVLLKLFFCVLIPNVVFVFLNIKSREFKEAVNFVRSIIKKKNINCNAKK